MFEDLIPSAPAQTPASPPGMFDDLIPAAASGEPDGLAAFRSTARTDSGSEGLGEADRGDQPTLPLSGSSSAPDGTSSRGFFDDLIPTAAVSGGAAGGAAGSLSPPYEPIPDPWLGLKDAKTGIPLVRESKPGRFIAEVAGEDDGGLFWKDPETGEIRRAGPNELIRPEGGKFKVYERDEIVRPWTWTDMALVRAIISGFTAPRDAFAGNMAPDEVSQRALDFASLASGGARTSFTAPRLRANPLRPEPEPGAEPTGPPPDQTPPPQNGAPSGAVPVSGGPQIVELPSHRFAGRPPEPGKAAIGDDGHPVELHHYDQVQGDLIFEITRTDHRLGRNFKINHKNTGQEKSRIDRPLFNAQRVQHWRQGLKKGRFDNLPELSETQKEELQDAAKSRMELDQPRSDE
jgi:hypothetical protein